MQSQEKTVAAYIKSLPEEKASIIREVRSLVNKNLPDGYKEVMRWGMISWEIPLSKYPDTYNGEPLNYVALAAQKNNFSLYLMGCYADPIAMDEFVREYKASGKPLNMGKSCVRFKKIEDLPLNLIAKNIKSCSAKKFIKLYENSRST
jgi:hypothetical protein